MKIGKPVLVTDFGRNRGKTGTVVGKKKGPVAVMRSGRFAIRLDESGEIYYTSSVRRYKKPRISA